MNPPFGLPEPVTFARVFDWAIARHGSREALVTDEGRIGFDALGDAVRRAAVGMAALGVRRGDHVGLLSGNSIAWVTLFYAAASLGAVVVPINTRFRSGELRYCLAQARVSTLFLAGRFLKVDFTDMLRRIEPALDAALPGVVLPDLLRVVVLGDTQSPTGAMPFDALVGLSGGAATAGGPDASDAHARRDAEPGDTLLIQYTSGTTAFPKGVMLTHRGMLQNAASSAARIGVRSGDRYFSVRPFFHVGGTTLTLLVALIAGATVVTLPTFDVSRTLRMMSEERCTLTSGNDTIFQMLMAHDMFDPSTLCVRGGWAAVGPETMRRIRERLGAREMVNAYGLSEASPNVAMNDWRDPVHLRVDGWALPHAGTQIRIDHPQRGGPAGPHEPGEIQVQGWHVMKGYFDMPAETALAIDRDGWLRTGDLGMMDEQGRLRMVGRLKDVFRVGGENVSPAEIEEALLRHPAIAIAQVVGVPDARLVEVPAAYIQPIAGASINEAEVIDWCAARCANFKVPRYVRIVSSFDWAPLTSSGKVVKAALRAHAIREFGLREPSRT